MAKITRFTGNLEAFASAAQALERTVFGGATQSDTLDDNINTDFFRGWQNGTDINGYPTKQFFNALGFTLSQLIAYLHQAGIAEWDSAQEYHDGSLVNVSGVVYKSLTDTNVGNDPLTDQVNWAKASGGLDWMVKDAAYTASDGEGILVNTLSGTVTITLPLTPQEGEAVAISDFKHNFDTNACTVARNGSNIMGLAEDLILGAKNQGVTLVYSDATEGWIIVDATPISNSVNDMSTTVLTASGTYSKPSNLLFAIVEIIGGGGGGGGCDGQGGGTFGAAGGGGSGGSSKRLFLASELAASETVTIGSGGGAGGTGSSGSNGGNTLFGTHLTGNGGNGGTSVTSVTNVNNAQGGDGGAASGGDTNTPGKPGGAGIVTDGGPVGSATSGEGGSGRYGTGGRAKTADVPGSAGQGYGAGGSGGVTTDTTNRVGGGGTQGAVIIIEFLRTT